MASLLNKMGVDRHNPIWRLLSDNGVRHWKGYALAFVLLGVTAAMTGLSAWIMRDVINELFVDRNAQAIQLIAVAVAAIFIIKGATTYAAQVVLRRIGNAIVADIQHRMYDRMLGERIDFFDTFNIGDLATRLSHNAQAARNAMTTLITGLGRDGLTLIALVIVMIAQNPRMSLIAITMAPPAIWGVTFLIRRVKKIAKAQFVSMTRIVSTVQETALGVRVIKAFGLEARMRGRMSGAIEDVRRRADGMALMQAAPIPLMETLAGLVIAAVILYAGSEVIGGRQDPGAFFSFLTALLLAYDPARRVAQLSVRLRTYLVGVELMYQILDRKPRLREAEAAPALALSGGEVRLEGVAFDYDPPELAVPMEAAQKGKDRAGRKTAEDGADTHSDAGAAAGDEPAPHAAADASVTADVPPPNRRQATGSALQDVTLTAAAGQVTALVGPSGAGKSTIFSLIERFYDPTRGRVKIDGQDIAGVTTASLRAALGHVGQEAFLFDATVAENIRLGRPDASDAEIEAAAVAANAHDFIAALPDGYATELGENGARLSGGQRQRVAIARAMLRGAPILLLDEPTSALDAETEARVAEALSRLMHGRTTLVIAHRLATIRGADTIHVIDGGRIVQSGSHDALLAEGGLYARLYALQFGGGGAVSGAGDAVSGGVEPDPTHRP